MPNRIVREGLLDSARYWAVTIEARQLFWHLMLLADDFGCVSLAPVFIRRRCFDDSPSVEKVNGLLEQLVDGNLIRIYESDGARYGFIPRFRQRLQRMTLKHPIPPAKLIGDDPDAVEKFRKINRKAEELTDGQQLANGQPPDGQPPEAEEKKKEQAAPDGAPVSVVWTLGVSALVEQGISEQTARGFLGGLVRDWDEAVVAEAVRAAVGKADMKSYVRGYLNKQPKKGADAGGRLGFDRVAT